MFPPRSLGKWEQQIITDYTVQIARALGVVGLMNVQYVIYEDRVYVLEVNPRASRTVPFMSKVTGVPMVAAATRAMLGESLASQGYTTGLMEPPPFVTVKAPVFSFEKLGEVDVFLGPEMKSTGEVLGMAKEYYQALYKAISASGAPIPRSGTILATLADKDKPEGIQLLKEFYAFGYRFVATEGTANALETLGIPVERVKKVTEGTPNVLSYIKEGRVDLIINTPTRGKVPERNGFQIRRTAVEYKVPCFTSLDTAKAVLEVLRAQRAGQTLEPISLSELLTMAGRV